ncbi:13387_t:CDS:2, partial [Cetraspora pellucida]
LDRVRLGLYLQNEQIDAKKTYKTITVLKETQRNTFIISVIHLISVIYLVNVIHLVDAGIAAATS